MFAIDSETRLKLEKQEKHNWIFTPSRHTIWYRRCFNVMCPLGWLKYLHTYEAPRTYIYNRDYPNNYFKHPSKHFHLLRQLLFSSRTIIRLWPWSRDITGLGLLTNRLATSGKQRPVDVVKVECPPGWGFRTCGDWLILKVSLTSVIILLVNNSESSGKPSKLRDIMRSWSQSEYGSRWEPKLS